MKITTKFDIGSHLYRVVHDKQNGRTTSSLAEYVIVSIRVNQTERGPVKIQYNLCPEEYHTGTPLPDSYNGVWLQENELSDEYYPTREQALAGEVEKTEEALTRAIRALATVL